MGSWGGTRAANAVLFGALACGLMAAAGNAPRASAQQPTIDKVSIDDSAKNQRGARVSGKWVIFEDDRRQVAGTSTVDVRFWSTDNKDDKRATETPVARHAAISGNLVAWSQPATQGTDIVVYDLKDREVARRIERAGDQDFPAISGQKVVWQENNSGSQDIVGFDLTDRERFTVTEVAGDQTRPAIDGDLVAFEDGRDTTIWYRDVKTEQLRKIENITGFEPAVSGNRIAFRSGGSRDNPENANIHVFDRTTNTLSAGLVSTLEGKRGNPRIDGNLVVWWDTRRGDRDIYGYDLATKTEFLISGDGGDQDEPDVSSGMVVWSDRRGSDSDVRGARLNAAQATATPGATVTPGASAGATPTPPDARAPRDARFFVEGGFRIDNDQFWDYFRTRGGVKNFGYPASRTFRFMGFTTQFFQRHVMQLGPQGPRLMNLLDPGLMPYTQINTSTFPAFDEAMARQAPQVGSANYDVEIVRFVQQHAPDSFQGSGVAFFSTFANQVDLATAFPSGGANLNLLPLVNLELAGSVTSRPLVDPRNGGFVYQRFQRVILHYDASCPCTQPILLGDWFKAIITGRNLPTDLAAQAQGSPFHMQYNNSAATGLNRPAALPDTDMRFAFEPQ